MELNANFAIYRVTCMPSYCLWWLNTPLMNLSYPLSRTHFHNYGLAISSDTSFLTAHTLFPTELAIRPSLQSVHHTLSHHLPQHNPSLTQTPLNQTPPTTKLMTAQPQDLFLSSLFSYCMLCCVCCQPESPCTTQQSLIFSHTHGKEEKRGCLLYPIKTLYTA